MICKYAVIFCWKNVSSFCSAKATRIFSAKNIKILYIESAKTVNEMTLNELVKLTTLWTTGPWFLALHSERWAPSKEQLVPSLKSLVCSLVLRFYDPVNPVRSSRAQSVYLATLLLGRLSSLIGLLYCAHSFAKIWQLPFLNLWYDSAGFEPATSLSQSGFSTNSATLSFRGHRKPILTRISVKPMDAPRTCNSRNRKHYPR